MVQKKVIILKSTQSDRIIGSATCFLSSGGIGADIKSGDYRDGYLILESDAIPVTAVKLGSVQPFDVPAQDFARGFKAVLAEIKSGALMPIAYGTSGAVNNDITVEGLIRRAQRRFAGKVFIPDSNLHSAETIPQKSTAQSHTKLDKAVKPQESKGTQQMPRVGKDIQDIPQQQSINSQRQSASTQKDGKKSQQHIQAEQERTTFSESQGSESGIYGKTNKSDADAVSKGGEQYSESKETDIAKKNITAEYAQEEYAKAWQDYAQEIDGESDKYLFEDTTLADIDLIAEEDYFKFGTKDKESKKVPPQNITGEYFPIPPPQKPDIERQEIHRVYPCAAGKGTAGSIGGSIGGKSHSGKDSQGIDKSSADAEGANGGYGGIIINKNYERGEQRMRYYNSIKDGITQLFKNNPKETELEKMLPDSQFVRVYYAEDKHYCVGILRQEGMPVYICYGVPSDTYGEAPPQLENKSRFVPLSHLNPKGKGYFMLFQSVDDGTIIDTR